MRQHLKRTLAVLFGLVCATALLCGSAFAADEVESGTCGENLTWVLDSEGTLTISGSGEMEDFIGTTPWSERYDSIQTVVLDPGVTSISYGAFIGCSSLADVVIPDSVTIIGDFAFEDCSSLTSVTLPDGLTYPDSAFNTTPWWTVAEGACGKQGNNLTWELNRKGTLNINGSGEMGNFDSYEQTPPWSSYCERIQTVILESGVTSIGDAALFNCSSLASVAIPDSVTSIGEAAFFNCSSLTSVILPDNEHFTSIPEYTFDGCSSLTDINIPGSVTTIGEDAFGNSGLTSIEIPDSVTSIGIEAFIGCSSLTGVTLPDNEHFTSIPEYAFYDCSSLTSIEIPDSVTSIGNEAFYNCSGLTSVTLPNSVTKIFDNAFHGCSSLTNITIPNSVTTISDYAFNGCSSLASVAIPDSVTSMGDYAFVACSGLTSATLPENEHFTSIPRGTFNGCSLLTDISIPGSVTTIGINAFCGSGLTSIEIPDSVTSIDKHAFWYCRNLVSVTLPDSVTSFGDSLFENCPSLESIRFSGDPPALTDALFQGLTATAYYPLGNPNWTDNMFQNYGGTLTWHYYADLSDCTVTLGATSYTYDGTAKKPAVTVKYDDITLTKDTDYTVAYTNNINAGTATVTVTGKGGISGTETCVFNINPADLSTATVTITSPSYTGKALTPVPAVMLGSKTLTMGTDYDLSYDNNVNVGKDTATVTVTGNGNYTGTVSKTFTINPKSLTAAMATLSATSYPYNGTVKKPAVTVKDGATALKAGTDYTLSNPGGTTPGTYTITVTGKGNYTDTVTKTFTIKPKPLTTSMAILSATSYTYNGKAKKPAVTVKDGTTVLKSGIDYTVDYINNTNAGSAYALITGIGNYSGTLLKSFNIKPKTLTAAMATLNTVSYTYNGKAKKPAATVKNGTTVLKSGTDYTVDYINNTKAGTAYAILTGKGNYSGTVTKTFTIKKAANPLTVKPLTATVKYSAVKSKAQTLAVSKVLTVTKAQGAKTYVKTSGNAGITINKTTGKVTIKKGLKKGTYKIRVAVKAAGNANYKAGTKTVTVTVKVS